jgi:hypothetical protein
MRDFLVGCVVDATFEDANIHTILVRFFQVCDGCSAEIRELRNFDDALIDIQ